MKVFKSLKWFGKAILVITLRAGLALAQSAYEPIVVMRRRWIFVSVLCALLCLFNLSLAQAAGTVTITSVKYWVGGGQNRTIITLSWTADAADATVPSTTIDAALYVIKGWYLYSAETNPGATAPTDNYDIVLNDTDDLDIAGGLLQNRDTANTEMVNIGTSAHGYPVVKGNLTFSLSNNAVNSATGTLILTFVAN